jgi:hypothetical protein
MPSPRASVYRNTHRDRWSIMERGRGVRHSRVVILSDAALVVRPGGHAAAVRRGHKTVHAFARGTLVLDGRYAFSPAKWQQLFYDYRTDDAFHLLDATKTPVHRAEAVYLASDGGCWAFNPELTDAK